MKHYILWISLFAPVSCWGMEEETSPIATPTKSVFEVTGEGITTQILTPTIKHTTSSTISQAITVPIIDISVRPDGILYLLAEQNKTKNYLFKKSKQDNPTIVDIEYKKLYKAIDNEYFAFEYNTDKTLNITKGEKEAVHAQAKHTHSINTFGTIDNQLFTGSIWPSIKKVNFEFNRQSPDYSIQATPFINNAFLLACSDNGMVIAKINEKDNGWFWFWRRFNKPHQCNVTLYALFFGPKEATFIDKQFIEESIARAEKKEMVRYK